MTKVNDSRIGANAWTIAGSDSSGAAGLQADLRAFAAFAVDGSSVVTAVTAQSLDEFLASTPMRAEVVSDQLRALARTGRPRAIKIGMLGSAENVETVAAWLAAGSRDDKCPVVFDPVWRSTSGGTLADDATVAASIQKILPLASLVTPNIPEAERLTGLRAAGIEDLPRLAAALRELGARRVLLKGGHARQISPQNGECHDYYTDGQTSFWLTTQWYPALTRGTGCALSAAIAAAVATGLELGCAVVAARAHIARGLRLAAERAPPNANDAGEVNNASAGNELPPNPARRIRLPQPPWPVSPVDMPWLTSTLKGARERPQFANCGSAALGFYPIVDRADWVVRLVKVGVRTIQLRIKDLSGEALQSEVALAARACAAAEVRLFINDHWRAALLEAKSGHSPTGIYGVHLGQEDLEKMTHADAMMLAASGLHLGISTHSLSELARAIAWRPSYLALGPIFSTTCKSMRFGPQGFSRLREWRSLTDLPLVAIGGLQLQHAEHLLDNGADGIAVIADISQNPDPERRTRDWLQMLEKLCIKARTAPGPVL